MKITAHERSHLGGRAVVPLPANDNGGRRVLFRLAPRPSITIAEIEVFDALLAEIESAPANDNYIEAT